MTLSALGDSAFVLSFGEGIDDAVLSRVHAAAEALREAALPGVVDVVAAFAAVTVFYDIGSSGPYSVFEPRVCEIAERGAAAAPRASSARRVEIPVCYGGEFGPDLADVARAAGAGLSEVIDWHAAVEYRVHAIGFVPGFGYLGGLPKKLHTPRHQTPRSSVPAGSVGIGGAQTGIYPMTTPGGWNIVGRTPLRMFDPARTAPAVLQAGDYVKFNPISPEEFATWTSG